MFGSQWRAQKYPEQGVYFVMRGCKPNANVATMRITFNCEFIPVGDYIPICPLDFAISGPRTSDAVQAMVTMCP